MHTPSSVNKHGDETCKNRWDHDNTGSEGNVRVSMVDSACANAELPPSEIPKHSA